MLAQRIIRGYLARKQHQPRYKGIMKIKAIKINLTKTEEIANQLKSNKETVLKQVRDVEQLIDRSVSKIKVNCNKQTNKKLFDWHMTNVFQLGFSVTDGSTNQTERD